MNTLKRLSSIMTILVLIAVMTPLTAQSQQEAKPAAPAAIAFWVAPDYNEAARDYQRGEIVAWGEEHGFEVSISEFGWQDLYTKVKAALAAENEPDLANEVDANTYFLALNAGRLHALDDMLDDLKALGTEFIPDYYASAKTADGHYYQFRDRISPELFFLRTDKIASVGYSKIDTLDQFKDAAIKMNDPANNFYGSGMTLGGDMDAEKTFRAFWWNMGGKLVEADGKTVALNSPATIAMIEYFKELYDKNVNPQDAVGWGGADNNKAYLEGRIGATINTGSILTAMRNENPELLKNSAVTLPPGGAGGRSTFISALSSGGIMIFKSTKNVQACKDLLIHIMKPDTISKYFELANGGWVPTMIVAQNLDIWNDPYNKAFIDGVNNSHAPGWPGSSSLPAEEILGTKLLTTNLLGRVLVGGWTPAKAAAETERLVSDIYAKY